MAKGKTAGDKAMLDTYPDEENYVTAQKREGTRKGVSDFVKNVASVTPEQIDNTVNTILKNPRLTDEERDNVKKSLMKSNIIDKDGNINHDPENYVRAMATYKAGTMTDDSRITIGGITHDLDRDVIANTTRVNTNASEVHQTGDGTRFHNGLSGNVKQAAIEKATGSNLSHITTDADGNEKSAMELAGSFAGGALIVGATAHVISEQLTDKGVWENVRGAGEKLRRFFSGEKETMEEPTNHHNNNNGNTAPNESTGHSHNKTPSLNDRLTANYNTKTPEAKAWYKEIGKSFAKTKAGKILGAGAALIGLSSLAGAAEQEYSEFSGDNQTTMPPQNSTPELSPMDKGVIMGTATLGNGVTAMYGMQELKAGSGAASKVLAKDGTKLAGKKIRVKN